MSKLKIKKGDKVQVVTGKNKGRVGDVIKVFPSKNSIIVSGVNLCKKHTKPSQTSEGGVIQKELPIHVSNVSHIDPKTNEITKVGYKILENGEKVRFAKKSGEIISKEGKNNVN
jgi:large subunit ribosomal protein L24